MTAPFVCSIIPCRLIDRVRQNADCDAAYYALLLRLAPLATAPKGKESVFVRNHRLQRAPTGTFLAELAGVGSAAAFFRSRRRRAFSVSHGCQRCSWWSSWEWPPPICCSRRSQRVGSIAEKLVEAIR